MGSHMETALTYYGQGALGHPTDRAAELCPSDPRNWAPRTVPFMPVAAAVGPAVPAVLNHGRWLAQCATCNGAQYTSPEDPRFLCVECGNVAVGGKWLPVEWPADRAAIEALLEVRPALNQNWVPGETLELLATENERYGHTVSA